MYFRLVFFSLFFFFFSVNDLVKICQYRYVCILCMYYLYKYVCIYISVHAYRHTSTQTFFVFIVAKVNSWNPLWTLDGLPTVAGAGFYPKCLLLFSPLFALTDQMFVSRLRHFLDSDLDQVTRARLNQRSYCLFKDQNKASLPFINSCCLFPLLFWSYWLLAQHIHVSSLLLEMRLCIDST